MTNSQLLHLLINPTIVCRSCQLHEWYLLASLVTFSSQGNVLGNMGDPYSWPLQHVYTLMPQADLSLFTTGDISIQQQYTLTS